MLQRKGSIGEQAAQHTRRTGSNPNWRQDRESATKSLSALCALAAEVNDGWDEIVANIDDNEVKPHIVAIREANSHGDNAAESIVMTWGMRTGYVDHAAAILNKANDYWLTLKASGIMATFQRAGGDASWIRSDVALVYNSITPQQKEEVKQEVRDALGFKPSTKGNVSTLDPTDPARILAEIDRSREPDDPGERFAHWVNGTQAEEPTATPNGDPQPGKRKLGDKGPTTPATPAKRTLGAGKPVATPATQHPIATLLADAKKPAAKNLVKSLEGGKPPESVAKTAVALGVITQEQANQALK
ncbi:hypothetical protein HY573_01910 [Candidatus Parcubacteria bacterium]|nr:hypothetical protein [Candidatus Parcubacteria bacterium]